MDAIGSFDHSGSVTTTADIDTMKTNLSSIMAASEAANVLGKGVARRLVKTFRHHSRLRNLSCRSMDVSLPEDNGGGSEEDEEDTLIRALFYPFPNNTTHAAGAMEEPVTSTRKMPHYVKNAWEQRLLKEGLDKPGFIRMTVPSCAAPHTGAGGHMGVFDCLFTALAGLGKTKLLLPDLIIFFAVCRKAALSEEGSGSEDEQSGPGRDSHSIMILALLAFKIYDSYQKRSTITRDTLHRFLSEIHGEDSYKTPYVSSVLDPMFTMPDEERKSSTSKDIAMGRVVPHLTCSQFCQGIGDTVQADDTHILLDWITALGNSMLPRRDLAPSTKNYLEKMSPKKSLTALCQQYGFLDSSKSLYEIKRRFHSIVEASNKFDLDKMMPEEAESQRPGLPIEEAPKPSPHPPKPRHVISNDAFVSIISSPNTEMGCGGFLPKELAALTFQAGCSAEDEWDSSMYWGTYEVMVFGCTAVRKVVTKSSEEDASSYLLSLAKHDPDLRLLQFAFRVFGFVNDGNEEDEPSLPTTALSRKQIGKMLLLLLEHTSFRMEEDSPPQDQIDKRGNEPETEGVEVGETGELVKEVDVDTASVLGLLPIKFDLSSSKNGCHKVNLEVLIDYFLRESTEESEVPTSLSFDGFLHWIHKPSRQSTALSPSQRRLGPYLVELRLIAAIVFGIRPSLANLEDELIAEVQRRHKYGYPQTDSSLRGPSGTVWYVIDEPWYRAWISHVKRDETEDLGKIDNNKLLINNGSLALRKNLRWRQDYELVPPLAWSALQAWYDGGPPIYRFVVPYEPDTLLTNSPIKSSRKTPRGIIENEIELYPLFVTVHLCDSTTKGEARPFQQFVPVSRSRPMRHLLVDLCKSLSVDPKYGRLWVMGNPAATATEESYFPLTTNSISKPEENDWLVNLDESLILQARRRGLTIGEEGTKTAILLEQKDTLKNTWPRGLDGTLRRPSSMLMEVAGNNGDEERSAIVTGDGIVGLHNMGNTCYLNSSFQCLSHTPIFRDYFTTKSYLNDINSTNPLGYQGRLAQVSAVLINSLWKRYNHSAPVLPKTVTAPGAYTLISSKSLTPKTFKEALGKFNDHFAGNEQHDAQELLAFLLSGLSEDLNRIVDKPYIEAPDSDGRPDSELADIWWSNHLKRELSIVVALFTGQYKSLLTCRTCRYESARFEPFAFLQLPLPEDDQISVQLLLYPLREGVELMKYSVKVRHDGRLNDALVALARVLYMDKKHEIEARKREEADSQNGNGGGAPGSSNDSMENTGKLHINAAGDEGSTKDPEEDSEEFTEEELQLFHELAQNMAVVDMRDGYIFKIAPNSWALADIQNKDTGELPLLHVYELEALPTAEELDEENALETVQEEGESASSDGATSAEEPVADLIQNLNEKVAEISSPDSSDVADVEQQVAAVLDKQMKKQVEEDKETEPEPVRDVKFSFLALAQRKCDLVSRQQMHPFAQHVFGTPLLLRVWDLEGYTGRDLYDLVAARIRNFVPEGALRFLSHPDSNNEAEEDEIERDALATQCKGGRLDRRRTTSDMEEVAAGPLPRYGFRLRLATRDGKRCFLCPWYECCVGCLIPDDDYPAIVMCGDSIALDWHFAVDIATSGFGLRVNQGDGHTTPSASIRNRAMIDAKKHKSCTAEGKNRGYSGCITLEDCLDAFAKEEKIPEAYCSKCKEFRVQTKRMSLWRLPPVVIIHLKRFQFTQHMRRKLRDLVVFPVEGLDLSRIVASDTSSKADLNGDTEHTAEQSEASEDDQKLASKFDGRSDAPYDLYGVVHHQGALTGGHYVASLKSDLDGQWRLFNDAQIYEINSRDVVDSSAYILFYIRRDVKGLRLEDFWDTRMREGEGLTEEEVENLMKQQRDRCVIS